jgi:hypothetical protein
MAAPKEFSGKLGDAFPNIEAPSTFGDLKLHDYWGDGWGESVQRSWHSLLLSVSFGRSAVDPCCHFFSSLR